MGLAYC